MEKEDKLYEKKQQELKIKGIKSKNILNVVN